MSNTLFQAWVKNVYSLRMNSGVSSGKTQGSYTSPLSAYAVVWVKAPVYAHVSTNFSALLSTLKMSFQPLLIRQLYPLSTAPTIKRTKE